MSEVWTGRVIKHSPQMTAFGLKENEALLDTYYRPLTVLADEQDQGTTVRDVLVRHFKVSSKLLAQARLTEFGLTINEERVYISAPVKAGEIVRLRMEKEVSEFIEPEEMALDIIYEDESLLVINKPPQLIVHPTHGHYTGTLANGVVHYWQQKNEKFRFRPIHRLDEDTSGIVVIAKNGYVHQQLSELMQEGEMDKKYMCIVHGYVPFQPYEIEGAISRHPDTPHIRTVLEDGQYAKTGVRCLKHLELHTEHMEVNPIQLSLIELKLFTGRTHQIRVHMLHDGYPLIGDQFYYNNDLIEEEKALAFGRQALHAYELSLIHPITKEVLTFNAKLPDDMANIISNSREIKHA